MTQPSPGVRSGTRNRSQKAAFLVGLTPRLAVRPFATVKSEGSAATVSIVDWPVGSTK